MHIHTVFFWLKKDVSAVDRDRFEKELDKLTLDRRVLHRGIGKPATTNRSVIDRSYDYGISLCFKNLESHDNYQAGDAHLNFLKNCQELWADVKVYDMTDTYTGDQ